MSIDTVVARVQTWACSVPLDHPLSFGTFTIHSRDYTALRITTSGGLTADCLGLSRGAPVDAAAVEVLAPSVLGRDALDIDARLGDMDRATTALDRDGVIGRARSLIEICLWDLRAKAVGWPTWRLLGGAPRKVPVLLVEGYPLPNETDEAFAERLGARAAEGFTAIKVEAASCHNPDELAHRMALARRAVGDDVELMVDLAWSRPNARDGLEWIRRLEGCSPRWVEDPLPRGAAAEMSRLCSRSPVPIAAGDEASRPGELSDLLRASAVDVLRLDATTIGGYKAVQQLASEATERSREVSLHVHPEVHQHCAFAWPAIAHVEAFPLDRPFDVAHRLITEPFMANVQDGFALPPQTPGSGLVLNLDAVQRSTLRHGEAKL